MREAVLIFVKNLIPGQVKTRLAATIGNEAALNIYGELLQHTNHITQSLDAAKIVFYSSYIEEHDYWHIKDFKKQIQEGNDLGERMQHAFTSAFEEGYEKAVIMGSDCPGINEEIIKSAFVTLNKCDVAIGPASDGGYYLLGMKKLHAGLFKDVEWSTDVVLSQTIDRCRRSDLSYILLPVLDDVDEEKDLKYMKKKRLVI
ncbi:MAG: TIGR04282 family arsenosugar biosynthesis glycosyltransferase [Bacteroidota bacterium]|nr:TIGR04282 family arsenosugar biosynthesis glycosyltransferase [Bacteroidota bacterium]